MKKFISAVLIQLFFACLALAGTTVPFLPSAGAVAMETAIAQATAEATAEMIVVTPNLTALPTRYIPTPFDPAQVTEATNASAVTTSAAPVQVTYTAAPGSVTATAAGTTVSGSRIPEKITFDLSGITKIKISWEITPVEPFTFNIFRKTAAEKEFAIINSEPLKVTHYVDAAIKTATAYEYKIEAKDNSGNAYTSAASQVNSAGLGLPQKPFTFKTFQDIENVTIKWSAGTKGSFDISGYNLYRGKTPQRIEMYKFISAKNTKYDDDNVEPAIKYFYRMRTVDMGGYESEPTEIEAVVPFPKPRTGLVLMSTGYRNNIHDNFGLNADFLFTYYIGSLFSDYNWKGETLNPISLIIFTGDIKGTIFNEFDDWPSVGLGFTYSVILQYDLGGSEATGGGATFTPKSTVNQMYGLYIAASKKVIWDTTLHAGFMSGFGSNAQMRFMPYLSPYLSDDDGKTGGSVFIKQSNFAYSLGFGRPLLGKMDLKVEVIVPVEANKNALLPNYYLINTHIENFLRFDFGYFHFPGGSAFVGFINFRFSVYPNPYK